MGGGGFGGGEKRWRRGKNLSQRLWVCMQVSKEHNRSLATPVLLSQGPEVCLVQLDAQGNSSYILDRQKRRATDLQKAGRDSHGFKTSPEQANWGYGKVGWARKRTLQWQENLHD